MLIIFSVGVPKISVGAPNELLLGNAELSNFPKLFRVILEKGIRRTSIP
jgi:hypothetical protein